MYCKTKDKKYNKIRNKILTLSFKNFLIVLFERAHSLKVVRIGDKISQYVL